MSFDSHLALAGALAGFLVGLTGMGGGALLTPLLVLFFGVPPLTAVSSDLVTSLVMKPFAGAVHLRHGTVHLRLFGWLALGSVPAAFLASALIGSLGTGADAARLAGPLKIIIALALLASLAATLGRPWLARLRGAPRDARATGTTRTTEATSASGADGSAPPRLRIAPLRTIGIGVIGGLAVGLTSVGAGSLVIAMLLLAYPLLSPRELIGTDILQAIPLVGAAALGHLLFGDVHVGLTVSLLVGAVPAALVGARLSSSAADGLIRPVMSAVLAASALAMLGSPTALLLVGAAGTAFGVVAGPRLAARAVPPRLPDATAPLGVD